MIVSLLVLVGGREAGAVAIGTIAFGCDFTSLGTTSGPLPLSLSSDPSIYCSGNATVEPGVVETYAARSSAGGGIGAESGGEFSISDIVFSATGGGAGTAQVAVKVHVDGVVNVPYAGDVAAYRISLGQIETGTGSPGCNLTGVCELEVFFGGNGPFSVDYTTSTFLADLNTPWTLKVGGKAVAGAVQTSISATLGFQLGQEVFVLPAGITANSADGRILNNVFAPEPGTALLLAGGLVALATRRRCVSGPVEVS